LCQGGRAGGGGGYGGPRTNAKGFHGDERPDRRTEELLFRKPNTQTTGINFDKYDEIPVETSGEGCPECVETFSEEMVGPQLMTNLSLCNYLKPTPVQKWSVPIGLSGRDLMACAQTGSGKTAGFLFPTIVSMLRAGAPQLPPGVNTRRKQYPVALVLAPTRELASQIFEEAQKFCYCTGVREGQGAVCSQHDGHSMSHACLLIWSSYARGVGGRAGHPLTSSRSISLLRSGRW
jgi:ATP-dependent RNA helicase DDX3X